MIKKPSNPKDSVGIRKVPLSTVPATVVAEIGLAMLEGARKYGRHNYRVIGVLASVYYDAARRHLDDWWEGQDTDPASGLNHIIKALSSLVVLRDAMIQGKLVDDRPPPAPEGWIDELNARAAEIIERLPEARDSYTARPLGQPDEVQKRETILDLLYGRHVTPKMQAEDLGMIVPFPGALPVMPKEVSRDTNGPVHCPVCGGSIVRGMMCPDNKSFPECPMLGDGFERVLADKSCIGCRAAPGEKHGLGCWILRSML